jgi:hypothetical protein
MTLATLTISQLWGLAFGAFAVWILVVGIVLDNRIAASRKRRRERQAALRSGAILTGKGGAV